MGFKKISKLMIGIMVLAMVVGVLPIKTAEAKAAKLKLNNTKLTVYADSDFCIEIVNSKTGEADYTAISNATWSSSDENIVIVEKDGYFWAAKKGKATVSAYYNGKTYSCKVTVKNKKSTTKKDDSGSKSGSGSILDLLTEDVKVKLTVVLMEMAGLSDEEASYLIDYTIVCIDAGASWDDLDPDVRVVLEYVGITEDVYIQYTGNGKSGDGKSGDGKSESNTSKTETPWDKLSTEEQNLLLASGMTKEKYNEEHADEKKEDGDSGNSGNKKDWKNISSYTGAKYLYKGKTGYIVLEYEGKNLYRFLKFNTAGDLEWNCDWPMNKLKGDERKIPVNNKTYTFDYVLCYPMDWYPEEFANDRVFLRVTSKTFKLVMANYNQKKGKYKLNTETYSRVDTSKSTSK